MVLEQNLKICEEIKCLFYSAVVLLVLFVRVQDRFILKCIVCVCVRACWCGILKGVYIYN